MSVIIGVKALREVFKTVLFPAPRAIGTPLFSGRVGSRVEQNTIEAIGDHKLEVDG